MAQCYCNFRQQAFHKLLPFPMKGGFMRGSVDRIEDNIAVIVYDNGKTEDIVKTGGKIKVTTDSMKEEIIDLQNKVFRRCGKV